MTLLNLVAIAYSFSLSAGHSEFRMFEYGGFLDDKEIYVVSDFNIKLKIGPAYVGGGVLTPTICEDKWYGIGDYAPIQSSYTFTYGVNWRGFDAGYTYTCNHPIMVYLEDYNEVKRRIEGSYWKIFIKYEHEFKPFAERY